MAKTGWYPANVSPIHEGVYELLNASTGAVFYARWIITEGYYYFYAGWSTGHMKADDAGRETEFGLVQNRWQWRGLAAAPK
jgi:hypothetical protein